MLFCFFPNRLHVKDTGRWDTTKIEQLRRNRNSIEMDSALEPHSFSQNTFQEKVN